MRDNLTLPALRRRGRWWFVARKWQADQAASAVESLGIRPNLPSLLVKQLSGGNQQKVLLAKWLGTGPSVLILHEPTQGVDIGARHDILMALRRAADQGMAVILVSSEPEDLAAACDRVVVYGTHHKLIELHTPTPDALIDEVYGSDPTLTTTQRGA